MIVLYLGVQYTEFHAGEWTRGFLISFYLEPCIRPDEISRWIRQRNGIKFCANLGKSVTETLAMIRQACGEEGMRGIRRVQTHRGRKGEKGEEQSPENAHHFL
jgi:hypothetical protein